MICQRCGKWAGAHATLPGQSRDRLCMCQPARDARQLQHCAIAVSDWLAGGCDVNDIPRPHIAALVTWAKETSHEAANLERLRAPNIQPTTHGVARPPAAQDGWEVLGTEATESRIHAASSLVRDMDS